MTFKTKLLLASSLAGFALGATGFFWGIGFPVGAILLGLFLISKLLEKETALFNEEQRAHIAQAEVGNRPTDGQGQTLRTRLAAAGAGSRS